MRYCATITSVCYLICIGATLAHGPQLQVTNTGGKIVTRDILTDTYHPLTTPKSVYVMPVMEYQGAWYVRPETELNTTGPLAGQPKYYSGAGLAFGVGQTFAPGSVLTFKFDDGLEKWNGLAFQDAGDTQLQGYRGGTIGGMGQLNSPSQSAIGSDSGPFPGLTYPIPVPSVGPPPVVYNDQSHGTGRFRFLGDGTTPVLGSGTTATEPLDGVYLARFLLSSNDSNVADSDPFYFVMHKNAAWDDVQAAVRSLGVPSWEVQYLGVPEPSSLAMAGLAAALGAAAWRRRKA